MPARCSPTWSFTQAWLSAFGKPAESPREITDRPKPKGVEVLIPDVTNKIAVQDVLELGHKARVYKWAALHLSGRDSYNARCRAFS